MKKVIVRLMYILFAMCVLCGGYGYYLSNQERDIPENTHKNESNILSKISEDFMFFSSFFNIFFCFFILFSLVFLGFNYYIVIIS